MTKAKTMTKTITITMTMAMTKVLCRELKAENERLKARMGKGDVSEEELKDMAGKEVFETFRNSQIICQKKSVESFVNFS